MTLNIDGVDDDDVGSDFDVDVDAVAVDDDVAGRWMMDSGLLMTVHVDDR